MSKHRPDIAAAACGAVVGGASIAAVGSGTIATLAAAVVLGGALGLCRRHPTAAWLTATGAVATATPDGALSLLTFTLVAAHAFAAGRWAGRMSGAAGAVSLIAVTQVGVAVGHDSFVPYLIIPITAWAAGRAVRERELVAARLAERASDLESERDTYADLSVRYERARIAAELHDIVAHAISVMVVQAGAGQRLAVASPELAAETFEVIAGAARQAEEDMIRLVALLADEEATGEAPDMALVEELVARAARTGLDVTLRLEGTRDGLPELVAQVAFRVIQEGLTNALRYASGAAVRVLVRGGSEALTVEVVNGPALRAPALARQGTGNGLRGLRERLGACGGKLEAGPTADGGWHVSARVPRRVGAGVA